MLQRDGNPQKGSGKERAFNKAAGWVSDELCGKQSDRGEAVRNRKKARHKKPEKGIRLRGENGVRVNTTNKKLDPVVRNVCLDSLSDSVKTWCITFHLMSNPTLFTFKEKICTGRSYIIFLFLSFFMALRPDS